jgi:hypothetical protein
VKKRKAKCRPTFEPRGTTSMKHSMFELVPRATRWGQGEGGGTKAVLEHSCCEVTDGDEDEAIKARGRWVADGAHTEVGIVGGSERAACQRSNCHCTSGLS